LEKTVVDRSFVPFLHSFSPKIVTMADYLKSNNYYTAAFTGGLYMSQNQGFDKGFHEFSANKRIKLDMNVELRRVTRWIQQHKDVKFFLFFHTYEIHSPYTRDYFEKRMDQYPKDLDRKEVISRYDSGIHYADRNIEKLIKVLKEQGLYDNTIILITADHGERFDLMPQELKLHPNVGIHGHSLYDCEIKIPLIIGGWKKLPKGIRIDKQTRNIDILPTLLDLLEIPLRDNISGESLKNYFEDADGEDRLAYSETVKMLGNPTKVMYALRSGENKIIKNFHLADPENKSASHSVDWEFYDFKKTLGKKII
jgi:arylsulfatase A-like enzyme